MNETLSGVVARVTFENERTGFRVLRVDVPRRGPVTAVGHFQFVGPGTDVRMTGQLVFDSKHGEQFRVHTLVPVDPTTIDGITKYLGSGLIPGVGPGLAKRIVQAFGLQTLAVLDDNPARLSEVAGLGKKRCEDIQLSWRAQRGAGQLMLLLQTHGVSGNLARRIQEKYGEESARVVQSSPYRLAMEVSGIGFVTADRIAASMGISKDHPERVQAGVHHQIHQLQERGHVYAPRETLRLATASMLGVDEAFVDAAMDKLWASERIVIEDDCVALSALHRAEVSLAEQFHRVQRFGAPALDVAAAAVASFEARLGIELAPQQRRAVEAVCEHKVVVITGGPGVGKTTIVRAVLEVFRAAKLSTRFAAPTGRAAKRLSEATGAEAITLHRLLEFDPRLRRFQRGPERPIDAQAIVIDEASMIDVRLADSLMTAVPDPARVVFVGDVDQLPSVGPGAVLRDVIDSGAVCVVRLDEVFRQGSTSAIVRNAHAILAGNPPANSKEPSTPQDFFLIERTDAEHASRTIAELVTRRIPERFGFDPMSQVQVLCPMHKGATGTAALNELLQGSLNPDGVTLQRGAQRFREGDRVMQLRNDYDKEVFNGDLGRVRRIDLESRELTVDFDGHDARYTDADADDLTLAYATSIHKSQGSEYCAVVVPFLTAHFPMLSKNLLYTAVTRARELCVLVADPKAVNMALSDFRREERNTRLAERLRG